MADGQTPTTARLRRNGQFPPGVSGNPGGRPKGEIQVSELARLQTVAAVNTLVGLMTHGRMEQTRLRAAEVLLDRAWGRPMQPLEQKVDVKPGVVWHIRIGDVETDLQGRPIAMNGRPLKTPAALPAGRDDTRPAAISPRDHRNP